MDGIKRRSGDHRPVSWVFVILAALTLAGCSTYHTVSGEAVSAPAEVRIRFASPQLLVVHADNGDSTSVADVVEVRGRVMDRSEDMITLEARSARRLDARAPQRFASGAVVRVRQQDVDLRERSTGRTVWLILSLFAAASLVGAALKDDPPPVLRENLIHPVIVDFLILG